MYWCIQCYTFSLKVLYTFDLPSLYVLSLRDSILFIFNIIAHIHCVIPIPTSIKNLVVKISVLALSLTSYSCQCM